MNRLIIFILTLLCNGYVFSQMDSVLSVAVSHAIKHNPEIQSARKYYEASLAGVETQGSMPDPMLQFAYLPLPVETRLGPQTGRIGLSQQIPWFGILKHQKGLAGEKAKVQYLNYLKTSNEIIKSIRVVYHEIKITDKSLDTYQKHLRILEHLKDLAESRFRAGDQLVDILRVEMRINEIQYEIENLENIRKSQAKAWENLLHTDSIRIDSISHTYSLPDSIPTVEEMVIKALERNPQADLVAQEKSVLEMQRKLTQSKEGPMINLGIEYIFTGERSDMNPSGNGRDALILPKVGVSIPIFRKQYKARYQEIDLQTESLDMKYIAIENNFESLAANIHKDLSILKRSFAYYQKQNRLADKAVNVVISGYTSAKNSFDEVLELEIRKLNYELLIAKSVYQFHSKWALMEYMTGEKIIDIKE